MIRSRRASFRSSALRLATVIAGASIALTSASTAHAATACRSMSLSRAAAAGSCWRPFASSSPFNTQLGTNPQLASDNAAVQQHMQRYGWAMGGSTSGFSLPLDGSRPIFYASPSDPTMTIHCTSSEGPGTCQGANGVDINGAQISVPARARPEDNWDAHVTIVETATGTEYDMWHTSISGSTITAGTGAETNVANGSGTGGGGDAANFSLTAGLLRPAELESGHINHALVMVVPCTNATGPNNGYTWPANGGWGDFCGEYWQEQASDAPELGQLVKLNMSPGQIASSGAPAWQQTIMTALATYGAYIEDTEGSWHDEGMYVLTQGSASWTDLGQSDQWAAVARSFGQGADSLNSNVAIPTNKLEMVDTCVTEGTCPSSTTTGDPVTLARSAHGRARSHAHSRRAARLRRSVVRRARARRAARRSHLRGHRTHRRLVHADR